MPIDYSKSVIYSIRSHQTDKIYIGSTTQSLSKRIYKHRSVYDSFTKRNAGHYVSSYIMLEYPDNYIELIEEYPCENKQQLHKREGEIIRKYTNSVNQRIAGRTRKEWGIDNKEYLKQFHKNYHSTNRDKYNAMAKKNYYDRYKFNNQLLSVCGGCGQQMKIRSLYDNRHFPQSCLNYVLKEQRKILL